MKLPTLAAGLAPLLPRLRCPLCGGALCLQAGQSLVCEHRHTFDLSAKGYVNFAPGHGQQAEKYNAALFESRARVFADGFYAHVAAALADAVARHAPEAARGGMPEAASSGMAEAAADQALQAISPTAYGTAILGVPEPEPSPAPLLVDAGCGEGYYARALAARLPHALVAGVDLSRDAVLAAARQAPALRWFVADLTRLPFATGSVRALVDVLTPADYREFARVLAPDGLLYKIVPADDYLCEIRQAVAQQLRAEGFSNARVVSHLTERAEVLEVIPVRRTLPVTPAQAADFLRMTPMTFGLGEGALAQVMFSQITVAMELYVCRMRREE